MNTEVIGKTAEYAVIGAVLRYNEPDLLSQVLATTEISYFETPECRAIREILDSFENKPYDPTLLKLKLEETGKLNDPVTPEFLRTVIMNAPLPVTVSEHINALKIYNAQRNALNETNSILQGIKANNGDADELSKIVDDGIIKLGDLMSNVGHHEWVAFGDAVDDLLNRDDDTPSEYVPTGLPMLDEALNGGLGQGQMICLAARPGFGKTSLALDFARNAALKHDIPTLHFTMEMSKDENTVRLLGGLASISHRAIKNREYTPNEQNALEHWRNEIKGAPLFIDDRSELTLNDLFSTYYRLNAELKAREGKEIKLVTVDYLQLLQSNRKFGSRQEEVGYYSRRLKAFAKKNKVAVVALSQLNRGNKNSDVIHRPDVKDLRESGSIEQDSDIVLLLGKPEEDMVEDARGKMILIIGKNRHGPMLDIPLTFIAHYPRFEEREDDDMESSGSSESLEDW